MGYWMEAIRTEVPEQELPELKMLLRFASLRISDLFSICREKNCFQKLFVSLAKFLIQR